MYGNAMYLYIPKGINGFGTGFMKYSIILKL